MVCHGCPIVGRQYCWPVAQMSFWRDSTLVYQFGVHALECPHWGDIPLSASVNFDLQSRVTLSGPVAQSDIQSRTNLVSPIIVCDTVKFEVLERVIIGAVFIDAQLVDGLFISSSPWPGLWTGSPGLLRAWLGSIDCRFAPACCLPMTMSAACTTSWICCRTFASRVLMVASGPSDV